MIWLYIILYLIGGLLTSVGYVTYYYYKIEHEYKNWYRQNHTTSETFWGSLEYIDEPFLAIIIIPTYPIFLLIWGITYFIKKLYILPTLIVSWLDGRKDNGR